MLGIVVAIIGSFVNSLGLLLQKLAHVRNAALPPERRTSVWVICEYRVIAPPVRPRPRHAPTHLTHPPRHHHQAATSSTSAATSAT